MANNVDKTSSKYIVTKLHYKLCYKNKRNLIVLIISNVKAVFETVNKPKPSYEN